MTNAVLVQDRAATVKDRGLFSAQQGTDCCCESTDVWIVCILCVNPPPAGTVLPPNGYLLIAPGDVPPGWPIVFVDATYAVCWVTSYLTPMFNPGDVIADPVSFWPTCETCNAVGPPPFVASCRPCGCQQFPPDYVGPPGGTLYVVPSDLPAAQQNPDGSWVFRDSAFGVCWFTLGMPEETPPGAYIGTPSLFLPSCDACCSTATCPDPSVLPSSVFVSVAWTYSFNPPPEIPYESKPPMTFSLVVPKLSPVAGDLYFHAPSGSEFGCIAGLTTEDGCSMRVKVDISCVPGFDGLSHWKIGVACESSYKVNIPGTPDWVCDPDYVPPQCNPGLRFYVATGEKVGPAGSGPQGTYTFTSGGGFVVSSATITVS